MYLFAEDVQGSYKPNSTKDIGGMPCYQEELQWTDVDGQIKGKFQAHENFASTVGSGLLLKLCMDKIDMAQLTDKPNVPGLPENTTRMHLQNRSDVC